MSEPTIDELLQEVGRWESFYTSKDFSEGRALSQAIRAILEQVRASEYLAGTVAEWLVVKRGLELEAIRAFVERVEGRLPDYDTGRGAEAWLKGYHRAIRDELAAMEKEAE